MVTIIINSVFDTCTHSTGHINMWKHSEYNWMHTRCTDILHWFVSKIKDTIHTRIKSPNSALTPTIGSKIIHSARKVRVSETLSICSGENHCWRGKSCQTTAPSWCSIYGFTHRLGYTDMNTPTKPENQTRWVEDTADTSEIAGCATVFLFPEHGDQLNNSLFLWKKM